MPAGVDRAGAGGVLGLGDAEQHHAAQPERRPPRRPPSAASRGCAGRRPASTRSARGSSRPSRTNSGSTSWRGSQRGLGDHPAQRRAYGAAGAAGPAAGHRARSSLGTGSASLARRSPCGARRLALRRAGDRLAGLEHRQRGAPRRSRRARRRAPRRPASGASTSTRRPCSSAVLAVAGPITAITVDGCGLPAMPTRLRTVEDEVKTTASNLPVLIASRVGAGGGVARTVR